MAALGEPVRLERGERGPGSPEAAASRGAARPGPGCSLGSPFVVQPARVFLGVQFGSAQCRAPVGAPASPVPECCRLLVSVT